MSHLRLLLLVSLALFASCDKDDEKCEAKYVYSWGNGNNRSEFFAIFDSQNKILELYATTSGDDLIEQSYSYDDLGRITKMTSGDNATNYYYFGDTRIVEKVDGAGLIYHLEKRFYNEQNKLIKREEYFQSPENDLQLARYSVYTYMGENATQEKVYEKQEGSSEFTVRFSIDYTYDNKKLPFAASVFPDFALYPPRVNNLMTVVVQDILSGSEDETSYNYEYNASGYPTKKFEGQNLMQSFEYRCEPRTAP